MTINISGQVPAQAQNGMYDLEEQWKEDRTPDEIVAVVKIQRSGFKFDDAKQERRVTMKFTHIEPLTNGVMVGEALELLESACKKRGGAVEVPDSELDIFEDADEEETVDA
jgi:hypothetical protein